MMEHTKFWLNKPRYLTSRVTLYKAVIYPPTPRILRRRARGHPRRPRGRPRRSRLPPRRRSRPQKSRGCPRRQTRPSPAGQQPSVRVSQQGIKRHFSGFTRSESTHIVALDNFRISCPLSFYLVASKIAPSHSRQKLLSFATSSKFACSSMGPCPWRHERRRKEGFLKGFWAVYVLRALCGSGQRSDIF